MVMGEGIGMGEAMSMSIQGYAYGATNVCKDGNAEPWVYPYVCPWACPQG